MDGSDGSDPSVLDEPTMDESALDDYGNTLDNEQGTVDQETYDEAMACACDGSPGPERGWRLRGPAVAACCAVWAGSWRAATHCPAVRGTSRPAMRQQRWLGPGSPGGGCGLQDVLSWLHRRAALLAAMNMDDESSGEEGEAAADNSESTDDSRWG